MRPGTGDLLSEECFVCEKKQCEGCLELCEGCFVFEVVCWVLCV